MRARSLAYRRNPDVYRLKSVSWIDTHDVTGAAVQSTPLSGRIAAPCPADDRRQRGDRSAIQPSAPSTRMRIEGDFDFFASTEMRLSAIPPATRALRTIAARRSASAASAAFASILIGLAAGAAFTSVTIRAKRADAPPAKVASPGANNESGTAISRVAEASAPAPTQCGLEFGLLLLQRIRACLCAGEALGLRDLRARRFGGECCLLAFGACGLRFQSQAFGFFRADLRLQSLALQFRTRLRGVASREFELQTVAFAPQRVALVLQHLRLGDRTRRLDASFDHVGPVRAVASARFLQLQQGAARTRDFRAGMAAERGVGSEAVEACGELLVLLARHGGGPRRDRAARLGDTAGQDEKQGESTKRDQARTHCCSSKPVGAARSRETAAFSWRSRSTSARAAARRARAAASSLSARDWRANCAASS